MRSGSSEASWQPSPSKSLVLSDVQPTLPCGQLSFSSGTPSPSASAASGLSAPPSELGAPPSDGIVGAPASETPAHRTRHSSKGRRHRFRSPRCRRRSLHCSEPHHRRRNRLPTNNRHCNNRCLQCCHHRKLLLPRWHRCHTRVQDKARRNRGLHHNRPRCCHRSLRLRGKWWARNWHP